MTVRLEKDVRFLKRYAAGATLVCGVLFVSAFVRQGGTQRFGEIDVERINIVEPDGTLKMVISDQERQHPGIVNGKIIPRSGPRPPGMIFFNQLGDEMGGLIFGPNGGDGHFGSLTFDKVRGDQTIGFRHLEGDDGRYTTALEMWQQPDIPVDVMMEKFRAARAITDEAARDAAIQALIDAGELTTRRLFLGKGRDDATLLELSDIQGRPRIRMTVAADGTPTLEFLDEDGTVISRLPETAGAGKE